MTEEEEVRQWEYDTVYVRDEECQNYLAKLDEAGLDGWEFTGHVSDTGYGQTYLMKRPRRSSDPPGSVTGPGLTPNTEPERKE